ncbi:MAG: DNA topoisomerase 4 subunit A [Luteitalea sp.]|nr:DNA topoisomerase 4 subunit A [Luteitalea sp.]
MKRRRPPSDVSLFDLPESEGSGGTPPPPPPATGGGVDGEQPVALHEAAQSRYLNYALSVITARALPDVRDGLKPVQRRILYTMWQQSLTADVKHRKCAKVVGDVMGNYHPHGDTAIYDTLVRLAQPFSMRYPVIDGSGNFGSLDGDRAAAMRYTECRLARLADELLTELEQDTVPFRPSYDGTRTEPVVLPSRLPNLLVNGAMGIAVGMATNVPPHHLGEVCTALLKLIDNPDLTSVQLCRYVKGPDFPTAGQILNAPEELKEIYRTGSGTIRLRGTWEPGDLRRTSKTVYITAIPYNVDKSELVSRMADVVVARKLPPLLDVRDVSTDDVRIELELKRDADEKMVLAYLFRHTPLQVNIPVNLTCLVPTENEEVGRPERLDLKEALWYFLHFRLDVVTRRLEHELAALARRIHILQGFEKVFDALDEIIRIIRRSDGKADAAQTIMKQFALDADQTDAILELKIYRLARLEILIVRKELEEKRKRQRQIQGLLKSEQRRWDMVREEIEEVRNAYSPKADTRRTLIQGEIEDVDYRPDDFILDEDNVVIVSRDGWVKRQKEVKDLSTTRLREGDEVAAAVAGSTRATVAFFTNFGVAYTSRIVDVPASTGYGEPIQKLFKLKDGERIVSVISLDQRATPGLKPATEGAVPPCQAVAVTSDGYSLRFSLEAFIEPSTRAGRRFGRPVEGAEVVGVAIVDGRETIVAATREARAVLCRVEEVNFLAGPGRGVILIKIDPARDRVLGFMAARRAQDALTVETSRGAQQSISPAKYDVTGRGGKGRALLQRGQFVRIVSSLPAVPVLE